MSVEVDRDMLALRVSQAITRVCGRHPGLEKWPRTWDLVTAPDYTFIRLLYAWTPTDEVADRRLKEAGNALVAAWKQAAGEWEAAGRPAA